MCFTNWYSHLFSNEPVHLGNVPNRCFSLLLAPVPTCLNRVAAITFRLSFLFFKNSKSVIKKLIRNNIKYCLCNVFNRVYATTRTCKLSAVAAFPSVQTVSSLNEEWKPNEVQTLHMHTLPDPVWGELDCQVVSEKSQKPLMTHEFSAMTKCNATLTELTGARELTMEEAISCVCCSSAVLTASQRRRSMFCSELRDGAKIVFVTFGLAIVNGISPW